MDFTVRSASARPRFTLRSILPAAACAVTLSVASTSIESAAQESPLTAIISEISQHEADVNRINLEIGNLQEAVNQALVDLHDAQSLAEQARQGAAEARQRLDETQAEVEQAQDELDQISRSSYRSRGANGATVHADADARKDSLDRQTYLRKESEEKQRALEELQRARTEAANNESTLRQASRLADVRAAKAEEAELHARTTFDEALVSLEAHLAQRESASTSLQEAQAELVEQRPEAAAAMGIATESDTPDTGETEGSTSPGEETSAVESSEPETTEAPSIASDSEDEKSSDRGAETESSESESTDSESTESAETTESTSPVEPSESTESTVSTEPDSNSESQHETEAEGTESEHPATDESAADGNAGESDGADTANADEASAPSLEDFANPETVQAALDAFAEAVGDTQADHSNFDDPYTGTEEEESAGIASPSSSASANEAVAATDAEEGTDVAGVLPKVDDAQQVTDELRGTETVADGDRSQQIEAVIARAESQIGTPYVWGGGDANGATMGLDGNGYNGKAGYDCSGLVLYAFAGAGISLPHYTGYQYQRGTQVPASQMERGDLLFWGDGGSQHVAIYLGDGMMLEAPQTGMNVQKSPVRHNGMAPNVVRLI